MEHHQWDSIWLLRKQRREMNVVLCPIIIRNHGLEVGERIQVVFGLGPGITF